MVKIKKTVFCLTCYIGFLLQNAWQNIRCTFTKKKKNRYKMILGLKRIII